MVDDWKQSFVLIHVYGEYLQDKTLSIMEKYSSVCSSHLDKVEATGHCI